MLCRYVSELTCCRAASRRSPYSPPRGPEPTTTVATTSTTRKRSLFADLVSEGKDYLDSKRRRDDRDDDDDDEEDDGIDETALASSLSVICESDSGNKFFGAIHRLLFSRPLSLQSPSSWPPPEAPSTSRSSGRGGEPRSAEATGTDR